MQAQLWSGEPTIEEIKQRHQRELAELINLHDEQVRRLETSSAQQAAKSTSATGQQREKRFQLGVRQVVISNSNEQYDHTDIDGKQQESCCSSGRSMFGDSDPECRVSEDIPQIGFPESLDLETAKRLLQELTEEQICEFVAQPLEKPQVQLFSHEEEDSNSPSDVRKVQLALLLIWPDSQLLPTGRYGKTTQRLVTLTQRDLLGAKADSIVDAALWQRLSTTAISRRRSKPSDKQLEIQRQKEKEEFKTIENAKSEIALKALEGILD